MVTHLPSSFIWSTVTPFIVPCVPTGINTGVLTQPLVVKIVPARALVVEHSASILNLSVHSRSILTCFNNYFHVHFKEAL